MWRREEHYHKLNTALATVSFFAFSVLFLFFLSLRDIDTEIKPK
jgi:hypothetical protein